MIIPIVVASSRGDMFECDNVYSVYYVLCIEMATLITPIILISIFNLFTFMKLKKKALRIKQVKKKPAKNIDSQFRLVHNTILSNSDTCLPAQEKQMHNKSVNNLSPSSAQDFTNFNRSFNMKYVIILNPCKNFIIYHNFLLNPGTSKTVKTKVDQMRKSIRGQHVARMYQSQRGVPKTLTTFAAS